MKSCLDCFYCKKSNGTLKCKIPIQNPNNGEKEYFSMWAADGGYPKIIQLCQKNESRKIKSREIFKIAKYCNSFDNDPPIQEIP